MTDVFLSSSSSDKDTAASLRKALEAAGLDVSYRASDSLAADGSALSDIVERTPCVIVLWSTQAGGDPNRAHEVKLALSAWSADRLLLAVVDGAELPAGLRDLHTFDLAADRQRAIDQIVDRAKELRSAVRGALPSAPLWKPEAEATRSPGPARGPRSLGILVGIAVLLILAVIGVRSFYWPAEDRTEAPPPSAPAPGAPTPLPMPAPPPPPPVEPSWYADAWPWAVIGGATLVLSVGVLVAVRTRRGRKRLPVRQASAEAGAAAGGEAPQQIFVSYSRRDTDYVDRIVEHIEEAGYTVWIDREAGGHGTQRYAAPIVRAIKSARVVALMCSHNAFASDHVVREVYVAGDFRKPFLAFRLDEAQFPDELIYFLSGYPRIPADPIEPEQLREEIKRYVS